MLVVGLGNPGPEYAATRHNAGFRVVERLARRAGVALEERPFGGWLGSWLGGRLGDRLGHLAGGRIRGRFGRGHLRGVEVALLEPLTYMNRSGIAVGGACAALDLDDPTRSLVVVYDDLDLPFGRLRVRAGGGAGGHRGLADVQEHLGRSDFPRLRFGIGRPPPGEDPVAYVLSPFAPDEEADLDTHLERAADAVETIVLEGVTAAMDRFNPALRA